jgi:hypothetical protein
MLRKFLKIYTWVVLVLIVLVLGYALYAWTAGQTVQTYTAVFYAVIFALMLLATRWFIKRNLPKQ